MVALEDQSAETYRSANELLTANLAGASAQVLNLTGEFQCIRLCLAGPPALAYLTQADWELNLMNEAGVPSSGWIDGMTIQFDNGTVWHRVVEVPVVAPVIRHYYRHHRPIASDG
jgi:hypothetical protein